MSYALVTGASSGIGWELAKVFARNGHNLILVARSTDKLESLKSELKQSHKINVEVVSLDLSKQNSAEDLFILTQKKNLEVDILVNNAGFGDHGLFADHEKSRLEDMILLNILTLTKLTKLFLPQMLEKKSGKILNVASTAAFQAGPLMTVYYATKAYVLSFSEGLHEELDESGIAVTALCPGPTESGFMEAANVSNMALMEKIKMPTSKEVAEYGYRALMKNQAVAVHGVLNNILASSTGFAPRAITRKIVKKLQEKRNS